MEYTPTINGHPVFFKVVESQRVVVATMSGCDIDAVNYFDEISGLAVVPWKRSVSGKIALPASIKAVARCHPEDSFDPDTGKQIAYRKLRKKYWSKYADRVAKLAIILRKVFEDCNTEALKGLSIAHDINPTYGLVGGDAV